MSDAPLSYRTLADELNAVSAYIRVSDPGTIRAADFELSTTSAAAIVDDALEVIRRLADDDHDVFCSIHDAGECNCQ